MLMPSQAGTTTLEVKEVFDTRVAELMSYDAETMHMKVNI